MKIFSLIILLISLLSIADALPSLEDIKKTEDAPILIVPTGKRESLEPKVDGKNNGLARYYHPNGRM